MEINQPQWLQPHSESAQNKLPKKLKLFSTYTSKLPKSRLRYKTTRPRVVASFYTFRFKKRASKILAQLLQINVYHTTHEEPAMTTINANSNIRPNSNVPTASTTLPQPLTQPTVTDMIDRTRNPVTPIFASQPTASAFGRPVGQMAATRIKMYLKTVLTELASNKEQCLTILTQSFRCNEADAEKIYNAISTETFERTGQATVKLNGQTIDVIPPISFSSLRNPNGSACDIQAAYAPEEAKIYIAEELDQTPEKIHDLAVEELGHHLDQILNRT